MIADFAPVSFDQLNAQLDRARALVFMFHETREQRAMKRDLEARGAVEVHAELTLHQEMLVDSIVDALERKDFVEVTLLVEMFDTTIRTITEPAGAL